MAKKDSLSMVDILKSLFTGGKSSLRKKIKNNPDMQADIENVKGMLEKSLQDLKDMEKEFNY